MPPFLATMAFKIIAVLVIAASLYGIGRYHQWQADKQKMDAAIAQAATKAATTVIQEAENTAKVMTKYIKVKGDTEIRTETIEKEVIRYVDRPHSVCVLDREFERVWDDSNDLRHAASATGGVDGAADSGLTSATVLSAHAADAHAYFTLKDRYTALVEWVKTTYAIRRESQP